MTYDNDEGREYKDGQKRTTLFCKKSTRDEVNDLKAHLRFNNFDDLWEFLVDNQKRNDRRVREWLKRNMRK